MSKECYELSKIKEDLLQNESFISTELSNLKKNLEELTANKEEVMHLVDVTKNENSLLQNSLINLKKVLKLKKNISLFNQFLIQIFAMCKIARLNQN